jgi:hypothetical protein
MQQLLADRATEGVRGTDAAALDEWLAINPAVDADVFERAAAVVALTRTSADEEALPTSLRDKLFADAEVFFARSDGT